MEASTIKSCIDRFRNQPPAPPQTRNKFTKELFWWIEEVSNNEANHPLMTESIDQQGCDAATPSNAADENLEIETVAEFKIDANSLQSNSLQSPAKDDDNGPKPRHEISCFSELDKYAESLLRRCDELLLESEIDSEAASTDISKPTLTTNNKKSLDKLPIKINQNTNILDSDETFARDGTFNINSDSDDSDNDDITDEMLSKYIQNLKIKSCYTSPSTSPLPQTRHRTHAKRNASVSRSNRSKRIKHRSLRIKHHMSSHKPTSSNIADSTTDASQVDPVTILQTPLNVSTKIIHSQFSSQPSRPVQQLIPSQRLEQFYSTTPATLNTTLVNTVINTLHSNPHSTHPHSNTYSTAKSVHKATTSIVGSNESNSTTAIATVCTLVTASPDRTPGNTLEKALDTVQDPASGVLTEVQCHQFGPDSASSVIESSSVFMYLSDSDGDEYYKDDETVQVEANKEHKYTIDVEDYGSPSLTQQQLHDDTQSAISAKNSNSLKNEVKRQTHKETKRTEQNTVERCNQELPDNLASACSLYPQAPTTQSPSQTQSQSYTPFLTEEYLRPYLGDPVVLQLWGRLLTVRNNLSTQQ